MILQGGTLKEFKMFKKILFIFLVPFLGLAKAEESVLTIYTDCNDPVDLKLEGQGPYLYKVEAYQKTFTIFYEEGSKEINVITWEGVKTPEQVEKEVFSGKITGNHKVIIKDSLTKLWESLKTENPLK